MLSKAKKAIPVISILYLAPLLVFAQIGARATDLGGVARTIMQVLGLIAPIIIALAVIYFLIGVFKYIMAAGEEEAKTQGRHMMIYGVIALFIMVVVWGLIYVLARTFGLDPGAGPAFDPSGLIPGL